MIQDIAPQVFRNEYENRQAQDEDIVLAFSGRNILVAENGEKFSCPKVRDFYNSGKDKTKLQYLFSINDWRYFLFTSSEKLNLEGYHYDSLSYLRKAQPKSLSFAGETAYHLYVWYRDNKYCGRCGHPTMRHEKMRAMECPACGNVIFPKIAS